MRSSNLLKYIIAFFALFISACGACRTAIDTTPNALPIVNETKGKVPFAIKEPDAFQTEIVVAANGVDDKFFAAKNGANRLTIFDFQTTFERSVLQTAANQTFLIDARRKIYVENAATINAFGDEKDSPLNFLTAEWTNQRADAQFETLGAENDLKKFRVFLNDSNASEILIWFDERIGLPVKQEFYQVNGGQKNLALSVELKNFTFQPDAKLFELSKNFSKVSMREFQAARREER